MFQLLFIGLIQNVLLQRSNANSLLRKNFVNILYYPGGLKEYSEKTVKK